MAATLHDYAHMAAAIYADAEAGMVQKLMDNGVTGWAVRYWQAGTPSNGFQGAILENEHEVVCVYKGSKGAPWSRSTTGFNDWCINDLQISLNMIPSQAHSAAEMVEVAERVLCGGRGNRRKPLSITGHSLGGGLAQMVGYLRQAPFVTFNAPGMKGNVESIPFVGKMAKGHANGFNMILWTDPVGNFGRHIGKTERFMTPGAFNPFGGGALSAHQMGSVLLALRNKRKWAEKHLSQLL